MASQEKSLEIGKRWVIDAMKRAKTLRNTSQGQSRPDSN
jgi:hypothetical protein